MCSDVANVSDGFSPQTNIVRMDGQRGVLVTVYKTGNASTLDIVSRRLRQAAAYPLNPAAAAGDDAARSTSPFSCAPPIQGVIREGIIAACLTGLMILLFLGNWRSTLIIAISIPLSILVSIVVLSALGETINIMTLGGLALAVGILVDDATVEIENINRNLAQGKETVRAILDGAQQIAVPALVSTLCICIVFVPMFFLTGVARYLFVPLAEAVVFAMLASYLLSRTLVPTMAMYLLEGPSRRGARHRQRSASRGCSAAFAQGFERMRERYRTSLGYCLEHAWMFMVLFLVFCVAFGAARAGAGPGFLPLGGRRVDPRCTCAPAPASAWKRPRANATRSTT